MADETKRKYLVVQEGANGDPIEIEGQLVNINDTIMLTDGEAKYRIGLSIERHPDNVVVEGVAGEHKEKPIEVQEDTRIMKEPKAWDEEVRTAKRPTRSVPADRE